MGLNVLLVCIKVHHVCTMPEETSGALELGLQVVVATMWRLRTSAWSSTRVASAMNC